MAVLLADDRRQTVALAIMNQKGGVGKSTAQGLANRVLVLAPVTV